ncbi:hypothetical protein V1293_003465 [Bradyrhizobium sp. AZCC 1693]
MGTELNPPELAEAINAKVFKARRVSASWP